METTFVISNKIQEILSKGKVYLPIKGQSVYADFIPRFGFYNGRDVAFLIDVDKPSKFNMFDFNVEGKITYWDTKKGEQPTNSSGKWLKEGRQEMKVSKFIQLIEKGFKIEAPEEIPRSVCLNSLYEHFNTVFKNFNEELNFKISDTPSEIYALDTSDMAGDYLKNSCMRPESSYICRHNSEMYDYLCKIIYDVDSNNCLLYRALLWEVIDEEGNERTFLDRIYGSTSVNNTLIAYAKRNNWLYRHFSNDDVFDSGEDFNFNIYHKTKDFNYNWSEEAPYMDTLHYFDEGTYTFTTENDCYESLQNCSGSIDGGTSEDEDSYYCTWCEEYHNQEEYYVESVDGYICESCMDRYFTRCEECGEYIEINGNSTVEHGYTYYCNTECAEQDNVYWCHICQSYEEGSNYIESEEIDICDNCFEDNYTRCEECDEIVNNDNLQEITTLEGIKISVCQSCFEEITLREEEELEEVERLKELELEESN